MVNPVAVPEGVRVDSDRTVTDAEAVARMELVICHHAARLGRAVGVAEDLEQEGRLGAVQAARRYDPASGVPFELYAVRRVVGRMVDFLRQKVSALTRNQLAIGMAVKTLSLSADRIGGGTMGDEIPAADVWGEVERAELVGVVRSAIAELPAPARRLVAGKKVRGIHSAEAAKVRAAAMDFLRDRLAEVSP